MGISPQKLDKEEIPVILDTYLLIKEEFLWKKS
jgi:hypothetical protein